MHESALILEVTEADPVVDRWRRHHDPIASHGIPPHITALYPFVPPAEITERCAHQVAGLLADVEPWTFRLTSIGQFPGVVWLRPDPGEPFIDLTERLWRAFPEHPPFSGRHDELVPHLTIAHVAADEDQDGLAARITDDLAPKLPIDCTARGLALYVSDRRRTWRCLYRFVFGEAHAAATGR